MPGSFIVSCGFYISFIFYSFSFLELPWRCRCSARSASTWICVGVCGCFWIVEWPGGYHGRACLTLSSTSDTKLQSNGPCPSSLLRMRCERCYNSTSAMLTQLQTPPPRRKGQRVCERVLDEDVQRVKLFIWQKRKKKEDKGTMISLTIWIKAISCTS